MQFVMPCHSRPGETYSWDLLQGGSWSQEMTGGAVPGAGDRAAVRGADRRRDEESEAPHLWGPADVEMG